MPSTLPAVAPSTPANPDIDADGSQGLRYDWGCRCGCDWGCRCGCDCGCNCTNSNTNIGVDFMHPTDAETKDWDNLRFEPCNRPGEPGSAETLDAMRVKSM
ncbi:MAG: hypothetical protein VKO65_02545 [Cyanobacteriota bacterium]|nr:hypothetical protein [Cyanobacteriota bacterium]